MQHLKSCCCISHCYLLHEVLGSHMQTSAGPSIDSVGCSSPAGPGVVGVVAAPATLCDSCAACPAACRVTAPCTGEGAGDVDGKAVDVGAGADVVGGGACPGSRPLRVGPGTGMDAGPGTGSGTPALWPTAEARSVAGAAAGADCAPAAGASCSAEPA